MAHRIAEKRAPEPTLRFLARGTALVPDYRAMKDTRTNRFHGWRWDGSLGPEVVDERTGAGLGYCHGGRRKLADHVVEVGPADPFRAEYLRHLRDGDLWAADEVTAGAAGVPYEPHFGGEHPAASAERGLGGEKLAERLRAHGFPEDAGVCAVPWDTEFRAKVEAPEPAAAQPAAKTKK